MASQARVTLLVPANATVAVTRVAAKARNFDRKEFITESTIDMEITAMPMPALFCHVTQSRSRAGLRRRLGRGGKMSLTLSVGANYRRPDQSGTTGFRDYKPRPVRPLCYCLCRE